MVSAADHIVPVLLLTIKHMEMLVVKSIHIQINRQAMALSIYSYMDKLGFF